MVGRKMMLLSVRIWSKTESLKLTMLMYFFDNTFALI